MISTLVKKINKTNASFIFVGLPGVGKKYTSFNLAKSSLCKSSPSCSVCSNCTRIDKGIHPNVLMIAPDGKDIKIERIRETIKDLSFRALELGKRFVIIDKAHRLNTSSANALLKTLEQPPEDTIFILCSENLHSMLATIRSRCEIVRFKPLKIDKIANILNISKDHFLLKYSQGSVSKAKFYLEHEEDFNSLLSLLNSDKILFSKVAELCDNNLNKFSNDISNIENIVSFIMYFLNFKLKESLDKNLDISNILDSINKVKELNSKIYYNTQAAYVLENIILETARCLGAR